MKGTELMMSLCQ